MSEYIFIISFLGFISSMVLVYKERKVPGYCPKFFEMPACYLVALAYVLVSLSVTINTIWLGVLVFWFGSVLGLILAIVFSYRKLTKKAECPKFFIIPLCYVSFLVFILLIILRLI